MTKITTLDQGTRSGFVGQGMSATGSGRFGIEVNGELVGEIRKEGNAWMVYEGRECIYSAYPFLGRNLKTAKAYAKDYFS